VIKVVEEGKTAHLGLGFADRQQLLLADGELCCIFFLSIFPFLTAVL
jgi:hypothetical protein